MRERQAGRWCFSMEVESCHCTSLGLWAQDGPAHPPAWWHRRLSLCAKKLREVNSCPVCSSFSLPSPSSSWSLEMVRAGRRVSPKTCVATANSCRQAAAVWQVPPRFTLQDHTPPGGTWQHLSACLRRARARETALQREVISWMPWEEPLGRHLGKSQPCWCICVLCVCVCACSNA